MFSSKSLAPCSLATRGKWTKPLCWKKSSDFCRNTMVRVMPLHFYPIPILLLAVTSSRWASSLVLSPQPSPSASVTGSLCPRHCTHHKSPSPTGLGEYTHFPNCFISRRKDSRGALQVTSSPMEWCHQWEHLDLKCLEQAFFIQSCRDAILRDSSSTESDCTGSSRHLCPHP